MTVELLRVDHLAKKFPAKSGSLFGRVKDHIHAVSDVSFDVRRGETLGLVGESGSGKSTVARCITRLHEPTSGQIVFDGHDITHLSNAQLAPFRSRIQMVF